MSSIQPVQYNILLRRYRTYSKTFYFTDGDNNALNLSAYTISAEIRKELSYTSDLVGTFNIDVSDAANGNITIYFNETETAAIAEGNGFWDMLFESVGGDIESWIEGKVEIRESITNVSP